MIDNSKSCVGRIVTHRWSLVAQNGISASSSTGIGLWPFGVGTNSFGSTPRCCLVCSCCNCGWLPCCPGCQVSSHTQCVSPRSLGDRRSLIPSVMYPRAFLFLDSHSIAESTWKLSFRIDLPELNVTCLAPLRGIYCFCSCWLLMLLLV